MSVGDLYAALNHHYNKLPPQLKLHYSEIYRKTDLPISNPEHKYSNEETKLLIEWLKSTKLPNKENLINHVIKVNRYGDISDDELNK